MQESLLPSAYRRVEYLQSDGTQTITLTHTFYENTNFTLVCQASQTNNNGVIIGYGATGGYYMSHNNGYYSLGGGVNFQSVNITDKITADINFGSRRIDVLIGNESLQRSASSIDPNITVYGLQMFGARNSNGWYYAKVRIFSFSAHGIVNLIPCVRKSDNKPGMYDTVSKTFFTNSGTGEFIIPT